MAQADSRLDGNVPAPAARATYQDVLDAPEHLVAELIDGTLYTHPRPAPRHATAGAGLLGRLRPAFDRGDDGPGGWRMLYEPELHLDDEILVPDLAGWRRERMPELPDTAYFTLTPDWICEVLAPSTRKLGPGAQTSHLRVSGAREPVARRPGGAHPRGVQAPRREVGAHRDRRRRRRGAHRAVRSGHVQPRRSVGLNRHATRARLPRRPAILTLPQPSHATAIESTRDVQSQRQLHAELWSGWLSGRPGVA